MMSWIMPRGTRLVPAAALMLMAAGCSDKNTSPAGPSDVQLDAQSVEQQAVSTLSFVEGLTSGVDQLAAGDFSGVSGDLGIPSGALQADPQPYYDAQTGTWVLDFQGTDTDATGSITYDVSFRVQYRDGSGTPMQTPDQTTATFTMSLDYVADAHSEDQGSTFDILLDYTLGMTVGNLSGGGPYQVDGSGDMYVDMQFSGDGDTLRLALDMGWDASLSVPANGGCPSGTASVSVEGWTFDAQYPGQPYYDWQLYQGASKVGEGSETLFCTVPAS